ncbi:MAG: phosphohistidine phosphatase SixA [Chloroflexota bacterium]|nr:phosphohistidine phosphatase SixA [Chloroflexota bacterium]
MKLFFLRHGIAEDATGGQRDADRALTPAGRAQLAQIAHALQRLGVKPQVVLTSPLVRAVQSAEIVAPVVGAPVEAVDELKPGCTLEHLQRLLRRYGQQPIMLVGHEPDFSALAAHLINAEERTLKLKKAGLIRLEVDGQLHPGHGRLTALLTPKMLLLMATNPTPEARKEPEDADDHGA